MKSISIVMATYNGEKYIREQIDSIVRQMKDSDELILTDDGSTDNTFSIIKEYQKDKRIKLYRGPQKGFPKNFENGLKETTKDIILFSDQDDLWLPDKLDRIRQFFETNVDIWLVLHDMYLANNDEIKEGTYCKKSFDMRKRKHGFLYNLFYNGYYGCCMGITKEYKKYLLPFPISVIQHDQWISLVAEYFHRAAFIDSPLIIHRIHDKNCYAKRRITTRLYYRYHLIASFLRTVKRIK